MSPNSGLPEPVSRRQFAHLVAAVAAAVTTSSVCADEPKPAEALTIDKAAEAVVRQRFGEHLTDAQVQRVAQRVASALQSSSYRKWPLKNSDEPAFTFFAD